MQIYIWRLYFFPSNPILYKLKVALTLSRHLQWMWQQLWLLCNVLKPKKKKKEKENTHTSSCKYGE